MYKRTIQSELTQARVFSMISVKRDVWVKGEANVGENFK